MRSGVASSWVTRGSSRASLSLLNAAETSSSATATWLTSARPERPRVRLVSGRPSRLGGGAAAGSGARVRTCQAPSRPPRLQRRRSRPVPGRVSPALVECPGQGVSHALVAVVPAQAVARAGGLPRARAACETSSSGSCLGGPSSSPALAGPPVSDPGVRPFWRRRAISRPLQQSRRRRTSSRIRSMSIMGGDTRHLLGRGRVRPSRDRRASRPDARRVGQPDAPPPCPGTP